MKRLIYLVLLILVANSCFATHIVGGEVFYTYIGAGGAAGTSQYKISLRLFRDCDVQCGGESGVACLPSQALVAIYENNNPEDYPSINSYTLFLESSQQLSLTDYPPCLIGKPSVCYEVKTYAATVILADNEMGYIVAYQNCCRASTLNVVNDNPALPQRLPGATYDCSIPGKKDLPQGHNSTAVFNLKKPDLICQNNRFTLDYGATDPDLTDSVSFTFEDAYTTGLEYSGSNDSRPASAPPYKEVTYNVARNFSGMQPLGKEVTINPVTGQISGISPDAGLYVISVVVHEWRNNVQIAQHRKDFILRVESCDIPEAQLSASYVTCNGFDLTFTNQSTSASITSYYWDFGDPATITDTSGNPIATYTFPAAGTYKVTLITNKGGECADTAITEANVFPGFVADFTVSGSCYQNAFTFKDASTTQFGVINSWNWNFGDPATAGDTSHFQTPEPYKYNDTGRVMAQLIVTNSKGCTDTLSKAVVVIDRPILTVPFHDTIICIQDKVVLGAATDMPATYSWTPLSAIQNAQTAQPTVSPAATTTYHVRVDAGNDCVNTDSVTVNVVDRVQISLQKDTTICLGDTVQLNPESNGLYFTWVPSTALSSDTAKTPYASPGATTTYHLHARIGSCAADDAITVHAAPYPTADAGNAVAICYGAATQLAATYAGDVFTWSPGNTLTNANTTTPVANPYQTTLYTFTTRNTAAGSCPKPVSDTVTVVVIPPVRVYAGRDTNMVIGQTMQLQATGAASYSWSPLSYLSESTIANPYVILPPSVTSITYAVNGSTAEGCTGTDSLTIYQYKTLPEIFIPSAFTPNNDGYNDVVRPVVAGMKRFNKFSIYNRWGQLLYTTSVTGQGWNGMFKDIPQPPGTYVYEATAVDYLDKPVVRKGTIVLIR